MMRPINLWVAFAVGIATPSIWAGENCLDNLRGGSSDVFCYVDEIKKVKQYLMAIYQGNKEKIPEASGYRKMLYNYIIKDDVDGYCQLIRGGNSGWGQDRLRQFSTSPGDVEYYDCLYSSVKLKEKNLKELMNLNK